jgi:hypothetical protein
MNNERLSILSSAMKAMDIAGQSIDSIDVRGDERGTVLVMKILSYLTKASMEAGRMMILSAPEGASVEGIVAAISEASSEVERLEIAAINREAALGDGKAPY